MSTIAAVMKWGKIALFTGAIFFAWTGAGWRVALSLFLLTWALNIARKTGTSV